jgi:hypothetical protein
MIVLGLILAVLGLLTGLGVLVTIGILLLIVGIVLNFVPVRGGKRRVW